VAEGQDPNDVARYLDLAFPMAGLLLICARRWIVRMLLIVFLSLGLVAVFLTASREGILVAIVALAGCGVLLARSRTRLAIRLSAAMALSGIAIWFAVPRATIERIRTIPAELTGGDLNQRWDIWGAGWNAFAHAPFIGTGVNTFVAAAGLAPIDTAHNTPLAISVETGVAGLVLATSILALSCVYALQTPGRLRPALITALLVLIMSSIVATVHENRATWLLLGVIASAGRIAKERPDDLARVFEAQSRHDLQLPPLGSTGQRREDE